MGRAVPPMNGRARRSSIRPFSIGSSHCLTQCGCSGCRTSSVSDHPSNGWEQPKQAGWEFRVLDLEDLADLKFLGLSASMMVCFKYRFRQMGLLRRYLCPKYFTPSELPNVVQDVQYQQYSSYKKFIARIAGMSSSVPTRNSTREVSNSRPLQHQPQNITSYELYSKLLVSP